LQRKFEKSFFLILLNSSSGVSCKLRGLILNFLNRVRTSLTGKLVLVLGLLIIIGSGIFWYISITTDKKNLMENTTTFISSFSEVVKKSIRYDMLLFKREDIQRTLESIGASESIKSVRVFDSKGVIHYSSDRKDIGRDVKMGSPACIGCHLDPAKPLETLKTEKRWSIYHEPSGNRVLGFVEPIYNEPDCYTASCHAHGRDQKVLGILTTDYSLYPIDTRIEAQILDTSLYMVSFVAVSIAILYFVLWKFVLNPVTSLTNGMKRISSGDLIQKVDVPARDELGGLARTFNAMMEELVMARTRMERWTDDLEEEVQKNVDEIKKTQSKLIQAEKLAALGRLTSDIAHEIRNPLTALGGFGRRLRKMASNQKEQEYADIIVSEVDRLEHILRDVLTFSRDARFHFEKLPATDIIRDSVATFTELCDDNSIKIDEYYETDLVVLIDKGQIRQAVNNLISNAIDAMPDGGKLTIRTSAEEKNNVKYVAVQISDTGPGISEEELLLIFEPFHTTKEIGHGTGLGLSISRKIIEEHGGFIWAANNSEGGLTVSLNFPYQGEEDRLMTPCWEFMKCGRDVDKELKCPAYPNFGRACWVVAGTYCEGKVQGTFAQKYADCRKCEFYNMVLNKEV
jgi:signal transduction histidine kinase